MSSLDDARRIAMSLPEVVEDLFGHESWVNWRVRGKTFAWERPLKPKDAADLSSLGRPVPLGEIVAVRTQGQPGKEELLAAGVPGVFTIPHFNRTAGLLVALAEIDVDELTELVTDAWLVQAPARLKNDFLASRDAD